MGGGSGGCGEGEGGGRFVRPGPGPAQRLERREIVVDRERNYYRQTWYDLETGEPAWGKDGDLDDPDMHGQSARRRKPGEDLL